jgi:hypothetical protein
MPARHRLLAVATAAAFVLAFAATAQAATISTDACVRSLPGIGGVKSMPIVAAGFTPGSLVTVKYASKISPTPTYLTSGTADANGTFGTAVFPPSFNKFSTQEQSFALGAYDDVNPAAVATTQFRQVRVGYELKPDHARPASTVRHTVRGFINNVPLYIHYRFGGKTKKTVKLGVTSSPCGIVTKRMPFLPVSPARTGRWNLFIDQKKKFSLKTSPQLRPSLIISTRFG